MRKFRFGSAIFIAFIFPLISSAASPNIYFAPYVSQLINGSLASSPTETPVSSEPNEMKYETSGQRFGFQAGPAFGNWILGFDLSQGHFNYKFNSPSGESVSDSIIRISQASGFVMYRRFNIVPWMGVIFKGHALDKRQNITYDNPFGFQIGVGFKLYRWLQFNIEARAYSFSKYTKDNIERSLPDDGREYFRGSEFLMGLSFTFDSAAGSRKK